MNLNSIAKYRRMILRLSNPSKSANDAKFNKNMNMADFARYAEDRFKLFSLSFLLDDCSDVLPLCNASRI